MILFTRAPFWLHGCVLYICNLFCSISALERSIEASSSFSSCHLSDFPLSPSPLHVLTAQTSVVHLPTTSTSRSDWPQVPVPRTACSRWRHRAVTARLGPSSAGTRPPHYWTRKNLQAVWWTSAWTEPWSLGSSVHPAESWNWGGRGRPAGRLNGCTRDHRVHPSMGSTRYWNITQNCSSSPNQI